MYSYIYTQQSFPNVTVTFRPVSYFGRRVGNKTFISGKVERTGKNYHHLPSRVRP
jgi:hypothetical protein